MRDYSQRMIEPDSTEWEIAWERLRNTGRDVSAWMLMNAEGAGMLTAYVFKHIDTRQYVRIERFA